MMLTLKDLRAHTLLGVYEQERQAQREVILTIKIQYDAANAVANDHIKDALDYAAIEKAVIQSLAQQNFALLERLAEHVAQLVLGFDKVCEVSVEIDKPGALEHATSVSVLHTLKR